MKTTYVVSFIYLLLRLSGLYAKFNDTIECHDTVIDDDFPSADGEEYEFPEKSIFFIETSCKGTINARQACSIESAAKAHPNWQINVLFAGPVPSQNQKDPIFSELQRYDNIKFLRIHVTKYSNDTPLANVLTRETLMKSKWRVLHSADFLRFLTLYKWGGVYLDLDVIVAKSFDSLFKNWVARESASMPGSACLAISRDEIGRRFAKATIRELQSNLKFDSFNHYGPGLLYRLLNQICSGCLVSTWSAFTCQGIEVYIEKYFFPIGFGHWHRYFEPGDVYIANDTHAFHTWNYLSKDTPVDRKSPFAKLAKRYCPRMSRMFRFTNWKI